MTSAADRQPDEVARWIGKAFAIPPEVMSVMAEEVELARKVREAREAAFWARLVQTVEKVNASLAPYGLSLSMSPEDGAPGTHYLTNRPGIDR